MLNAADVMPRLAGNTALMIFCEERCGADAADNVLVSKTALDDLSLFFSPAVDVAVAQLGKLTKSEWFVSERLFRTTADEEARRLREYSYGGDVELFGLCFGESAPHFSLLSCNISQGLVLKVPVQRTTTGSLCFDDKTFDTLADLARFKLGLGCHARDSSQWLNGGGNRAQKVRILQETLDLVAGFAVTANVGKEPSEPVPNQCASSIIKHGPPPKSEWSLFLLCQRGTPTLFDSRFHAIDKAPAMDTRASQ
jgi:hypothetical protein